MNIRTPLLTVDNIIRYRGGIVLIERKNPPSGWALPGGFVDTGESLEEAAIREAKEETSLDVTLVEQFHVYSKPGRDPRFHTVTVVFIADGKGTLKGKDDARKAEVFTEVTLPQKIAFDHRTIIEDYFAYCKSGNRPKP
ncbi:MAG TPA: NUDIX hydrolase [Deltaproteobacteria bacterium]|nr:NUDIX hydrolase [Deltaproteobacteria bacterium]